MQDLLAGVSKHDIQCWLSSALSAPLVISPISSCSLPTPLPSCPPLLSNPDELLLLECQGVDLLSQVDFILKEL